VPSRSGQASGDAESATASRGHACSGRTRWVHRPTVCLHTAPFMEAAIRMYERAGFRRAPEYDGEAGEVMNAGVMGSRIPALAYRLDLNPRTSVQLARSISGRWQTA
jgi:ribosomal protein S18 acetylase RimI-like enzyme